MISNQQLPQIPKKPMDRLLEYLRFTKAKKFIPKDTHLLDIGTGDGAFLRFLNGHVRYHIHDKTYFQRLGVNQNSIFLDKKAFFNYTKI